MANSPEYIEHLLELLQPTVPVAAKRMFGGHGLFAHDVMFGLVASDVLFLKVDEKNRAEFEAAGTDPFVYDGKGKPIAMSYFECPAEAFDDPSAMADWARSAVDAALRQNKKKPAKRKRAPKGK